MKEFIYKIAIVSILLSLSLSSFSQFVDSFSQFVENVPIPKEPNPTIDSNLLKLCENAQEEQEVTSYIAETYKNYGTYLGGVIIQNDIDNSILGLLTGDDEVLGEILCNNIKACDLYTYMLLKGLEPISGLRRNKNSINKWADEVYIPAVYSALTNRQDKEPISIEETARRLDYLMEETLEKILTPEDRKKINTLADNYGICHDKHTIASYTARYFAVRMFWIDYFVFDHYLSANGIYDNSYKDKVGTQRDWLLRLMWLTRPICKDPENIIIVRTNELP